LLYDVVAAPVALLQPDLRWATRGCGVRTGRSVRVRVALWITGLKRSVPPRTSTHGSGLPRTEWIVDETPNLVLPSWLPELHGTIAEGVVLRSWALSEVWRIRLAGVVPSTVIAKRGIGDRGDEAARYRKLIVPLGIRAPRVLAEGEPGVVVLEDLGGDTLRDRPSFEGFQAAVRGLAEMRVSSATRLATDPLLASGLRRSDAEIVSLADQARTSLSWFRPDLAGALDQPIDALARGLRRLATEPATIVHGDYQARNLLHTSNGGIIAIDWSEAHVHAHVGDLYLLLSEGTKHSGIDLAQAHDLQDLFARETGTDPTSVADQLVTGGLCHSLTALHWVLHTAVHAFADAASWIDGLVTDCQQLSIHT
jgi:hypothetical protein